MPGSIFLHGFYKGGLPLVFRGRAQTKIIYFWKGPDMDPLPPPPPPLLAGGRGEIMQAVIVTGVSSTA